MNNFARRDIDLASRALHSADCPGLADQLTQNMEDRRSLEKVRDIVEKLNLDLSISLNLNNALEVFNELN